MISKSLLVIVTKSSLSITQNKYDGVNVHAVVFLKHDCMIQLLMKKHIIMHRVPCSTSLLYSFALCFSKPIGHTYNYNSFSSEANHP